MAEKAFHTIILQITDKYNIDLNVMDKESYLYFWIWFLIEMLKFSSFISFLPFLYAEL